MTQLGINSSGILGNLGLNNACQGDADLDSRCVKLDLDRSAAVCTSHSVFIVAKVIGVYVDSTVQTCTVSTSSLLACYGGEYWCLCDTLKRTPCHWHNTISLDLLDLSYYPF